MEKFKADEIKVVLLRGGQLCLPRLGDDLLVERKHLLCESPEDSGLAYLYDYDLELMCLKASADCVEDVLGQFDIVAVKTGITWGEAARIVIDQDYNVAWDWTESPDMITPPALTPENYGMAYEYAFSTPTEWNISPLMNGAVPSDINVTIEVIPSPTPQVNTATCGGANLWESK